MAVNITPYGENVDNAVTACDVYFGRIEARKRAATEIRELRNAYFALKVRKPIYKKYNRWIRSYSSLVFTKPKPTRNNLLREGHNILKSYSHVQCPYHICGQDDMWYDARAWNIAHALACIQAAYEYA